MLGLGLGLTSPLVGKRGGGGYDPLELDATFNRLAIRGFSGVPSDKFSGNIAIKYVTRDDGMLAQQDNLFRSQSRTDSIALPDGQGGVPGEGFTCTGLCFDLDSLLVGNDGRDLSGSGATSTPSIVRVSLTGEKLDEINIDALYGSHTTLQGVTVDPVDRSIWFAMPSLGQVKHVTANGVDLGDGFALAGVNGIAFDTLRDKLWCLVVSGSALTLRNLDGSVEASYTVVAEADHLFYDELRDYIWVSSGPNGGIGKATAYKASDGTLVGAASFPDATAIEGITIVDGSFYVCHDGFFHEPDGAVIQENQLQKYPAVAGLANVAWPIDRDPLSPYAVRGYLIEPGVTRLSDFPVDFQSWAAPVGGSIIANDTVAPDGFACC